MSDRAPDGRHGSTSAKSHQACNRGDQLTGLHGFSHVRLVTDCERARPIFGAHVGGQCDGRNTSTVTHVLLSNLLHQIVAVDHRKTDVADENVRSRARED